jgi:hypothetical protein
MRGALGNLAAIGFSRWDMTDQVERIKNIVQDCNLNLLVGSGLSRPFLATLGNIEFLLTECDDAKLAET